MENNIIGFRLVLLFVTHFDFNNTWNLVFKVTYSKKSNMNWATGKRKGTDDLGTYFEIFYWECLFNRSPINWIPPLIRHP